MQLLIKKQSHRAVLRFAHAEIIIPLATSLELHEMMQPLPLHQTYNYSNSSWRGEVLVSPMAANLQWDIYQNAQGITLVKMLYNEKRPCLNHHVNMHNIVRTVSIMII